MSEARLASMPARTHLAAVVIVMNTLPLTRLLMLTRRDFNRFDSRPGRPHFSNFGPPAERRPFCKKALYSVSNKRPWFSGFGRPLCSREHFSRFDPKVPHFSHYYLGYTLAPRV